MSNIGKDVILEDFMTFQDKNIFREAVLTVPISCMAFCTLPILTSIHFQERRGSY